MHAFLGGSFIYMTGSFGKSRAHNCLSASPTLLQFLIHGLPACLSRHALSRLHVIPCFQAFSTEWVPLGKGMLPWPFYLGLSNQRDGDGVLAFLSCIGRRLWWTCKGDESAFWCSAAACFGVCSNLWWSVWSPACPQRGSERKGVQTWLPEESPPLLKPNLPTTLHKTFKRDVRVVFFLAYRQERSSMQLLMHWLCCFRLWHIWQKDIVSCTRPFKEAMSTPQEMGTFVNKSSAADNCCFIWHKLQVLS